MKINKILCLLPYLPSLYRDLKKLKLQSRQSTHRFPISKFRAYPADSKKQSGTAKGHYFHQDLLVAQKIFLTNPAKHVDIGSRVDGFVAHVAAYRSIEVIDIRPLSTQSKNISFKQGNLLELGSEMHAYCDSLSCLHAIEHFGLGRYGDPIDFEGHLKGFENLKRILKPNGKLYLSCPIGAQRIEFNAHRVFAIDYILEIAEPDFRLESFSYVDDEGDLHPDTELSQELLSNNCGCHYGCGIFEFRKRA